MRRVGAAGLALLAVAVTPPPVEARSCVSNMMCGIEPTSVVLVATVASIGAPEAWKVYGTSVVSVALTDVRAIQGRAMPTVVSPTRGNEIAIEWTVGKRYVLSAEVDPTGHLFVSACSLVLSAEMADGVEAYVASRNKPSTGAWILGRIDVAAFDLDRRASPRGARIVLEGPSPRALNVDSDGTFALTGLAPGRYRLKATMPPSASHLVITGTDVVVSRGPRYCDVLTLRPRPRAARRVNAGSAGKLSNWRATSVDSVSTVAR